MAKAEAVRERAVIEYHPPGAPGLQLENDLALTTYIVKSGMFKDVTQEQVLVKILTGRELGLGPMASQQNIYVVPGQPPSFSAQLIAARIKASGKYDYRHKEHTDKKCVLTFYQKVNGQMEPVGDSSFTWDDAVRAELLKSNWKKWPRALLFSRALTQGARWYCPDVLGTVAAYTPDELGGETPAVDLVDVEVKEVK